MPYYFSPEERVRRSERARATFTKHGHAVQGPGRSPEFNTWKRLRQRCMNPKCKDWRNYGGRGIEICDQWKNDFARFYADMGPRPSSAHSIDRINNDGPYSPENCRWATRQEQNKNRRDSIYVEHAGKRLMLADWSEITGIGEETIRYRIKAGWTAAEALMIPPGTKGKFHRKARNASG